MFMFCRNPFILKIINTPADLRQKGRKCIDYQLEIK